jgi:hypothetical protein
MEKERCPKARIARNAEQNEPSDANEEGVAKEAMRPE